MFISKKKFRELEKRIADLEDKEQGQQKPSDIKLTLDGKEITSFMKNHD